ncbi:MAG TPA: hypothetical protein EYP19_07145 [Desulfobacterales bacterium]|nr:hypothetical protein [Desulfobacterales bacterium]
MDKPHLVYVKEAPVSDVKTMARYILKSVTDCTVRCNDLQAINYGEVGALLCESDLHSGGRTVDSGFTRSSTRPSRYWDTLAKAKGGESAINAHILQNHEGVRSIVNSFMHIYVRARRGRRCKFRRFAHTLYRLPHRAGVSVVS